VNSEAQWTAWPPLPLCPGTSCIAQTKGVQFFYKKICAESWRQRCLSDKQNRSASRKSAPNSMGPAPLTLHQGNRLCSPQRVWSLDLLILPSPFQNADCAAVIGGAISERFGKCYSIMLKALYKCRGLLYFTFTVRKTSLHARWHGVKWLLVLQCATTVHATRQFSHSSDPRQQRLFIFVCYSTRVELRRACALSYIRSSESHPSRRPARSPQPRLCTARAPAIRQAALHRSTSRIRNINQPKWRSSAGPGHLSDRYRTGDKSDSAPGAARKAI